LNVRKLLSAGAVAMAMLSVAGGAQAAQSSEELAEIRSQLLQLMQRVDKLEQENTALKAENTSLKAQGESLQTETRNLRKDVTTAAADVTKTKAADWTSRLSLKGDLRYRYEFLSDETVNAMGVQATADRYRDRLRARLLLDAKVADNLTVGFGIATGENGDPRSSNQTLTGVFNRKAFDLDLAYFDWKFASFGNLLAGKMKQPFFKPSQSVYFDSDVNPEGVAVAFNRGPWFGSAYGYFVNENSGAETTLTADTMLYGGQVGYKLPLGPSNLTLAAMYYDLAAAKGRAPFFNNNANGNTVVGGVLLNDYRVVDLAAEYSTALGKWPLLVWADLAQNQAADDQDEAFSGGVIFGKAANPGSFEFGIGYYSVEADAVFAQVFESDFANGLTDSDGLVLRAGYAPERNWTLNATYFLNDRNMDVPNAIGDTDVDFDRFQLDVNLKF
jgi:cell division protein FtsB